MREQLLEGRKPWNLGRKVLNWSPNLHPRGRDGRFVNVFKKILNMNIGDSRSLSDVVADAPNIQEATAWRTRDGWEVRTRASDGTYGTKISTQDVQRDDSIFDNVLQMVNGLQGFPDLPICPCGCGNKSKNGQMLYGHQERQRDSLNKKAMAGDEVAATALADMPPEWYDGFHMPSNNNEKETEKVHALDALRAEYGTREERETARRTPLDELRGVAADVSGHFQSDEDVSEFEGIDWVGDPDNPIDNLKKFVPEFAGWESRIDNWADLKNDDPDGWTEKVEEDELRDFFTMLSVANKKLQKEIEKLEIMAGRYNERVHGTKENKSLRDMDPDERRWFIAQVAQHAEAEKFELDKERLKIIKELDMLNIMYDEFDKDTLDRYDGVDEHDYALEQAMELEHQEWLLRAGVNIDMATPEEIQIAERRISAGKVRPPGKRGEDMPEGEWSAEWSRHIAKLEKIFAASKDERREERKEDFKQYEEEKDIVHKREELQRLLDLDSDAFWWEVQRRIEERKGSERELVPNSADDSADYDPEKLAKMEKRHKEVLDRHPLRFWMSGSLGSGEDDDDDVVLPPEVYAQFLMPFGKPDDGDNYDDDDTPDYDGADYEPDIDAILAELDKPTTTPSDKDADVDDDDVVPESDIGAILEDVDKPTTTPSDKDADVDVDTVLDEVLKDMESDPDFSASANENHEIASRVRAAEQALERALAGDRPGAYEALQQADPFPGRIRCRCACGGVLPEGSKRGDFLLGHDGRDRHEVLKAAHAGDRDAWRSLENDPTARRQFQAYVARRYRDQDGPELRVDGDEQFSEEELAYDPSRIPDGVPFDWEYAPLLDPGPGELSVQINRLETRRNRANTPTERGMLNGVIARMREPRAVLARPSERNNGSYEEVEAELRAKEMLEIAAGGKITWELVRRPKSWFELMRVLEGDQTEDTDGARIQEELGFLLRDLQRQIDFKQPESGWTEALRSIAPGVDRRSSHEINDLLNGEDLPGHLLTEDSDVEGYVYELRRQAALAQVDLDGYLRMDRLYPIIFSNARRGFTGRGGSIYKAMRQVWQRDFERKHDWSELPAWPKDEKDLRMILEHLDDGYKDISDNDLNSLIDLWEDINRKESSLMHGPTKPTTKSLISRWMVGYPGGGFSREYEAAGKLGGISTTSDKYLDFLGIDGMENAIYDALTNNPLTREDFMIDAREISRLQAAVRYQKSKRRMGYADRRAAPVIRDIDMKIEAQPSVADIDIRLAERDEFGAPLPVFMEGTLYKDGHFSVQNMVYQDTDVGPGRGVVGTAQLIDEVEVYEEVEAKLREMGARVGVSSLRVEGSTPAGREENEKLIQKAENLALSVWIDLGDGKVVEFFPQVANTKKAVGDVARGSIDVDRLGAIDRSVDFESPDGIAPDAQSAGFRMIPWGRRGSFEFTDMTAEEIEEFTQKLFPNARHQREIAGNLLFNSTTRRRGTVFSIQDGFADGSVNPQLDDVGLVHKFSVNRRIGAGSFMDQFMDVLQTWGVLSQSERLAHNRATRQGRQLRPGPELVDLEGESGKPIAVVSGASPAGDLASGIDGFVFASLGTGVGYGRGDIQFVFNPRNALRSDALVAPQDFGPEDDRFARYGQFAQKMGGAFGESIPADKLQTMIRNGRVEDLDGETHVFGESAELNIPRGVAWDQVSAISINDARVMAAAVERGYAAPPGIDDVLFEIDEEDLERFDLMMSMIKAKMPQAQIWFHWEERSDRSMTKMVGRVNREFGFSTPLKDPVINPSDFGRVDTAWPSTPDRLQKFGPEKVLEHLPQISDDMKLSDFDPEWAEFDNWTIGQMRELMKAIAEYGKGQNGSDLKHMAVSPIKQLEQKMTVGDKEIDLSAIKMITPENSEGFLPIWFKIDGENLFYDNSLDHVKRQRFMGQIARALRESGKFDDSHPIFDMKKTFEERWSIFMRMPFLAWDEVAEVV